MSVNVTRPKVFSDKMKALRIHCHDRVNRKPALALNAVRFIRRCRLRQQITQRGASNLWRIHADNCRDWRRLGENYLGRTGIFGKTTFAPASSTGIADATNAAVRCLRLLASNGKKESEAGGVAVRTCRRAADATFRRARNAYRLWNPVVATFRHARNAFSRSAAASARFRRAKSAYWCRELVVSTFRRARNAYSRGEPRPFRTTKKRSH